MEVWFYHLERRGLGEVLPILAGKAIDRGWRVVVQTVDAPRMKALDERLWTFRDDSFLPHAPADDIRAERQPVVLTTDTANPNGAVLRMYVDGAEIDLAPDETRYERAILLFDGRDEAELRAARAQWSRLKAAGFALAYWQQDEAGRWEQKVRSGETSPAT